jgi:hypothetical protein
MTHPFQSHYDRVKALLQKLRTALQDDPTFQDYRVRFDEYLEHNELELALHTACGALAERSSRPACSNEILEMVANAHIAMGLEDGCVDALQAP